MRKNIFNIVAVLSAAFALVTAVSCQEEPPVVVTPNFPELVEEYDLAPGSELHLTIQPNMAWTVSVSEESYKWFKIKDGRFERASMSGVSSETPVEITIVTTTEESFAIRACEVSLQMGTEKKVIAKYTLQAKEKTMEFYAAKVTDGVFEYADDALVYSETPLTATESIELVWDNTSRQYYFPVMVRSNFEWDVVWPEWARADITVNSRVGDVALEVYGISSKLPLEQTSGTITFKSGDEVKGTYNVVIPSSLDKFDFNLSGYTSLMFDHTCYFHSGSGSYTKDPVKGIIYGPQASRAIVLEYADGKYDVPATTSWVNLTVSAWDSVEGADVLQEREISVDVPRYGGNVDRQAMILILPATAPANVADLLTADKSQVKEEYAQYAISVTQSARPAEYLTFEETAEAMEEAGVIFEKSSKSLLPSKNFKFVEGCQDWQYNLSYVKEYASSKSALYVTEAFDAIEIYDAEGNLVTENLSEHWLSFSQLGDGLYGQIMMDNTKIAKEFEAAIDGYVVFKDDLGAVLCIVHCFYVAEEKFEEDVLEDASKKMLYGAQSQAAAAAAGATIHKVLAGPTYEKYKELQAPIYIVRYPVDNLSLQIRTSQQCMMYSCVGKKDGPEMVTIDDQLYKDKELYAKIDEYLLLEEQYRKDLADYNAGKLEKEPVAPKYPDVSNEKSTMGLLTFGPTALTTRTYPGYSKFNMKMPEKATEKKMEEVIQFGSSEVVQFIFICILDLENQQ